MCCTAGIEYHSCGFCLKVKQIMKYHLRKKHGNSGIAFDITVVKISHSKSTTHRKIKKKKTLNLRKKESEPLRRSKRNKSVEKKQGSEESIPNIETGYSSDEEPLQTFENDDDGSIITEQIKGENNEESLKTRQEAERVENKNLVMLEEQPNRVRTRARKLKSYKDSELNTTNPNGPSGKRGRKSRKDEEEDLLYACAHCDKACRTQHALNIHIRHKHKAEWKCQKCNKVFKYETHLKDHMRKKHKQNPSYDCDVCKKTFKSWNGMTTHRQTHEKRQMCQYCGKAFTYPNELKRHQRRKHTNKQYRCNICNRPFNSASDLEKHTSLHQEGVEFEKLLDGPELICDICGKTYANVHSLQTHRRIHSGDKPFACEICPYRSTNRGALRTHMLVHSGVAAYQCSYCPKKFKTSSHLVVHEKRHKGIRDFICSLCDKACINPHDLRVHMTKHSDERPFVCKYCTPEDDTSEDEANSNERQSEISALDSKENPQVTLQPRDENEAKLSDNKTSSEEISNITNAEQLLSTETRIGVKKYKSRSEQMYENELPSRSRKKVVAFKRKCGWLQHMRLRHADKLDEENIKPLPPDALDRTCGICNKRFSHKDKLEEHLKKHIEVEEKKPNSNRKECRFCSKTFTSSSNLYDHERRHQGIKRHFCEVCHAGFLCSYELRKHMVTHTDERPYECEYCESEGNAEKKVAFKTRNSWAFHMRAKHEDKLHLVNLTPWTSNKKHCCQYCGASYSGEKALTVHIRSHTGEKPFACVECEYRGVSQQALNTHKLSHSNLRIHQCHLCAKSFKTTSHLKQHLIRHRGLREHICNICGKACVTPFDLRTHLLTHSDERPFKCKHCPERTPDQNGQLPDDVYKGPTAFKRRYDWMEHIRNHHPDKLEEEKIPPRETPKPVLTRDQVCHVCGKAFTTKCHLNIHMRIHTGERPYACTRCDHRSVTKSALTKHMLVHSGVAAYQCECGVKFKTSNNLNRHRRKMNHRKPPPIPIRKGTDEQEHIQNDIHVIKPLENEMENTGNVSVNVSNAEHFPSQNKFSEIAQQLQTLPDEKVVIRDAILPEKPIQFELQLGMSHIPTITENVQQLPLLTDATQSARESTDIQNNQIEERQTAKQFFNFWYN